MKFNDLKGIVKNKIETGYNQFLFDNKNEGIAFNYKNSNMGIGCYILNYLDFFILKDFNAIIAYKEVENLFLEVLIRNNLIGSSALLDPVTITINIQTKAKVKLHTPHTYLEIRNNEDCDKFIELLISFIELDAIPFFSKWKELTTLYDFIKKLNEDELSDILSVHYQFKKAIIMRFCNDCNYQGYMDSYYEQQKKYYEEDPDEENNIRYYNAAKELKQILDNTRPIYNI